MVSCSGRVISRRMSRAWLAVAESWATAGVAMAERASSTDAAMRVGTKAVYLVLCTSLSSVEVALLCFAACDAPMPLLPAVFQGPLHGERLAQPDGSRA